MFRYLSIAVLLSMSVVLLFSTARATAICDGRDVACTGDRCAVCTLDPTGARDAACEALPRTEATLAQPECFAAAPRPELVVWQGAQLPPLTADDLRIATPGVLLEPAPRLE